MSETCTIVRKIKLFPMGDKEEINRVYTYLREGIESQNRAMNQYMSALYMAMMQEVSKEDRKEINFLTEQGFIFSKGKEIGNNYTKH